MHLTGGETTIAGEPENQDGIIRRSIQFVGLSVLHPLPAFKKIASDRLSQTSHLAPLFVISLYLVEHAPI